MKEKELYSGSQRERRAFGGSVGEGEFCWGKGQVGRETLSEGVREGEGNMVGAVYEGRDERELGSGRSGSVNCDRGQ